MFEIMFSIVFILILSMFVVTIVKSIVQWNKNNHSPRLTVEAKVVAKRTSVSQHHTNTGAPMTSTSYYVTFQVSSGDRIEFSVSGREYGMLAEGDFGNLSFQGTRSMMWEDIDQDEIVDVRI